MPNDDDAAIDELLRDLQAAIDRLKDAAYPGVSPQEQYDSILGFCGLLRRVVAVDGLWNRLTILTGPCLPPLPTGEGEQLLTDVASVLGDAHEEMLRRCNWVKPPVLERLVDDTRRAVLHAPSTSVSEEREQRWGHRHIANARAALQQFVEEVLAQLAKIRKSGGTRRAMMALHKLFAHVRRVAAATGLLVVLAGTTITTGPEFDAAVTVGGDDLVQIEITVPVPWAGDSTDRAMSAGTTAILIDACVVTLGETVDTIDYRNGITPVLRPRGERWFEISPTLHRVAIALPELPPDGQRQDLDHRVDVRPNAQAIGPQRTREGTAERKRTDVTGRPPHIRPNRPTARPVKPRKPGLGPV